MEFKYEQQEAIQQQTKGNSDAANKRGSLQLWQFLLQLLSQDDTALMIEWTKMSAAEFKLLDPEEVARRWGHQKNRPTMNYDKLSRSLRYYYEKGIMQKVAGERYVYRFINHAEICQFNPTLSHCLTVHHQQTNHRQSDSLNNSIHSTKSTHKRLRAMHSATSRITPKLKASHRQHTGASSVQQRYSPYYRTSPCHSSHQQQYQHLPSNYFSSNYTVEAEISDNISTNTSVYNPSAYSSQVGTAQPTESTYLSNTYQYQGYQDYPYSESNYAQYYNSGYYTSSGSVSPKPKESNCQYYAPIININQHTNYIQQSPQLNYTYDTCSVYGTHASTPKSTSSSSNSQFNQMAYLPNKMAGCYSPMSITDNLSSSSVSSTSSVSNYSNYTAEHAPDLSLPVNNSYY